MARAFVCSGGIVRSSSPQITSVGTWMDPTNSLKSGREARASIVATRLETGAARTICRTVMNRSAFPAFVGERRLREVWTA